MNASRFVHRDAGGYRHDIVEAGLPPLHSRNENSRSVHPGCSGGIHGLRNAFRKKALLLPWDAGHPIPSGPQNRSLPEAPNLVLHAPQAASQRDIAAEGRVTPCDHLVQRRATGHFQGRATCVLGGAVLGLGYCLKDPGFIQYKASPVT